MKTSPMTNERGMWLAISSLFSLVVKMESCDHQIWRPQRAAPIFGPNLVETAGDLKTPLPAIKDGSQRPDGKTLSTFPFQIC